MRLCFHQTINYNSRFWFLIYFLLFSIKKPSKLLLDLILKEVIHSGNWRFVLFFYVVHSCLTAHNSLNGYAISMQIFRRFRKLSDIIILYYLYGKQYFTASPPPSLVACCMSYYMACTLIFSIVYETIFYFIQCDPFMIYMYVTNTNISKVHTLR